MAKRKTNSKPKVKRSTKERFFDDLNAYIDERGLTPSPDSPVCRKCKLHSQGCKNPFIEAYGSDDPLITIVVERVTKPEDKAGALGHADGWVAYILRKLDGIVALKPELKSVTRDRIRVVSVTKCSPPGGKDLKAASGHCRIHLVEDLYRHRPKLIIPVGTICLGALSHKSNAQDWAGRLLTYRGWPDDWLMDSAFTNGHPIFGRRPNPDDYIPIMPLQSPSMIAAMGTQKAQLDWLNHLSNALHVVVRGVPVRNYVKPWYVLTHDVEKIKQDLIWLAEHPKTLTTFDTETTGLKAFTANARIVMLMFRWEQDGKPRSLAFPWDYATSEMLPYLDELAPYILNALYACILQGHNLPFDILFVYATFRKYGSKLHKLTSAMHTDTLHMLYTISQRIGSMGLELTAYDYVEDLAGYEEEMTLLIGLIDEMNPEKGGHYANCPKPKWDTALKPYVLGDVEVCHRAAEVLNQELEETVEWKIPLADPARRGYFKYFRTPSRHDVYRAIMRPSSRLLTRFMGRGMHVDINSLTHQEEEMPRQIIEAREAIRKGNEKIIKWAEQKEATDPEWEFDLEKKDQAKELIFDVLDLPIQRLTKTGRKKYGETAEKWEHLTREELIKFAAVDKFTLNQLSVSCPDIRPLQEYRKIFKQYTGFIRPLRNHFAAGVDKKPRVADQHLMPDSRVHGQFMLAGARSGRLRCVHEDTIINVSIDGEVRARRIIDFNGNIDITGGRALVWTHKQRWRPVVRVFYKGYESMFRLTTRNGSYIVGTAKHGILGLSGWVDLKDLRAGDRIWTDGAAHQLDEVVSIEYAGKHGVWDIEVEEDHSYVAQGLIHHNSAQPNLQNLPKEGSFKQVFSSRYGRDGCLYGSDLSQIELRVTACACGDASMVRAYTENLDLHALTHSKVYNRDYEECTKKWMEKLEAEGNHELAKTLDIERRTAKIVNFLTSYGGGAMGLQGVLAAQRVYKDEFECRDIIDAFLGAYPGLRDLISVYKQFIIDNGCAVSILGRVRRFDEVYSSDKQQANKALRAGFNHVIQSTASDMLLLSLCYIEKQMRAAKLDSILVSTVHDSLLIDAKIKELPVVHEIVMDALNDIPKVLKHWFGEHYSTRWMIIPFGGDSDVGYNYGNMVKVGSDPNPKWATLLEQSRH